MNETMSNSNNKEREAIEDLWAAVFGDAPQVRCDPHLLADMLIRNLPPVPPYGDPPGQRDHEPLPSIRLPELPTRR
jgi:hypothetical protein